MAKRETNLAAQAGEHDFLPSEKDYSTAAFEAFIANSGPVKVENELDRRIAIYLIQRISNAIHQHSENVAAQFKIHVSDFYVILLLHRAQPDCVAPSGELQKALALTSGGMTRRLDRLQERGLLERIPDPKDRRAWLVQLTDIGKELAVNIRASSVSSSNMTDGDLETDEWKTLVTLLQKLSSTIVI